MSDRSDAETTELLLDWLREYGVTIIIGIVLGLIAVFAYQTYEERTEKSLQENSAKLVQLSNAIKANADVEKIYNELKVEKEFSVWAALLYGNSLLTKQKYDEAITILKNATNSNDEFVAQSAWYQIAQAQIATDKLDEANKTIERLRGSFLSEKLHYLQRSILIKQGKLSEALATIPAEKSHLLALEEAVIRARLAVAK